MNSARYPTYAINLILSTPWDQFSGMDIMDETLRNVKSLLPQGLISIIYSETDPYSPEKHELLQNHLSAISPMLMHGNNRFHATMSVLQSIRHYVQPVKKECDHLKERLSDTKMVLDSCNKDVETLKRYEQNLVTLASRATPPVTPTIQRTAPKDNNRPLNNNNPFSPQVQHSKNLGSQLTAPRMAKTPPMTKRSGLNTSTPSSNPFANVTRNNVSNNYNINNPPPFMPTPDSPPSHSEYPPAMPANIPSPNTAKKRDRDFERRAEYGNQTHEFQPADEQAKPKKQKTVPVSLHLSLDNFRK
uniref:Uncharacterized protein n=1 Tax=Clandestinovirus TaxID=2831644 RepID=A0A8F8KPV4_9VIRU|nr:hypothetical protein KOM_12_588 [Clandestinovirus]